MTKYYCKYLNSSVSEKDNICCKSHDNAYGKRGVISTSGEYVTRSQADKALRECLGNTFTAYIVWALCRTFGWIFWQKEKGR